MVGLCLETTEICRKSLFRHHCPRTAWSHHWPTDKSIAKADVISRTLFEDCLWSTQIPPPKEEDIASETKAIKRTSLLRASGLFKYMIQNSAA